MWATLTASQRIIPLLLGSSVLVLTAACTVSDTWTCDDVDCDDPHMFYGFAAMVCGRDEVRFTGSYLHSVTSGDILQEETDMIEIAVECGTFNPKWEWEPGEDVSLVRGAKNDDAKKFWDTWGRWEQGEITAEDARRELLGAR